MTNMDTTKHILCLIFVADKDKNAKLIHVFSNKSRRVIIAVLGAESIGLNDACFSSTVIQHDLKIAFGKYSK